MESELPGMTPQGLANRLWAAAASRSQVMSHLSCEVMRGAGLLKHVLDTVVDLSEDREYL